MSIGKESRLGDFDLCPLTFYIEQFHCGGSIHAQILNSPENVRSLLVDLLRILFSRPIAQINAAHDVISGTDGDVHLSVCARSERTE